MIDIKNPEQVQMMREGGRILAETLSAVMAAIKPGVSELELDALAERLIREQGGEPGFKKVKGYHHTICMATNDVVVHGIPTAYVFKPGDVVCVDCGVFYKGFHTDMADTIVVADEMDTAKKKFLDTGKRALEAGIAQAVWLVTGSDESSMKNLKYQDTWLARLKTRHDW
jgi:methionyl aminopeptidase